MVGAGDQFRAGAQAADRRRRAADRAGAGHRGDQRRAAVPAAAHRRGRRAATPAGCWCTGCCGCRSTSSTPAAPAIWSPGSGRTPPCCASVVTSGLVDAVSGALVFVGSVIAMALISLPLLGSDAGRGGGRDRRRHRARWPHPEADPHRADPGRAAGRRGGPGDPRHPHHPRGRRHRAGDRRAGSAGGQRLSDRRAAGEGDGADRADHRDRAAGRVHRWCWASVATWSRTAPCRSPSWSRSSSTCS